MISLERPIRGAACTCLPSSSFPIVLSDNTLDIKEDKYRCEIDLEMRLL